MCIKLVVAKSKITAKCVGRCSRINYICTTLDVFNKCMSRGAFASAVFPETVAFWM